MSPATNITGWTLQLNISRNGIAILQNSTPSITDEVNGIFTFTLTAGQTGTTLGIDTFNFNVWRMDVGNETILAYGIVNVLPYSPPAPV